MEKHKEALDAFERLLDIMNDLRALCPWDRKQTFESLRSLTIEETYELADALINRNMDEVKKELGDLLLHIVFYAKLGSEIDAFTIKDVINQLNDKLVYRHPHIYGNVKADNEEEVSKNWEQLKLKEKQGNKTILGGIAKATPAMVKANRIQQKVANVGFDWDEKQQVWNKVKEEINELEHELQNTHDADKQEAEFGDVFFSLVNAARLHGIDPETALERTNQKFIRRFNYLEQKTIAQGKDLHTMSLAEMDKYWDEAKRGE